MEDQIKRVMADVLVLDAETIDESTTQDSTASWDSLRQINLVIALEQEFSVSFEVNEIESMLSFTDIVETLERKISQAVHDQ